MAKNVFSLALFVFALFNSSLVQAQVLLQENLGSSASDFKLYQQNFSNYQYNNPDSKGQKWLQRWSQFYSSRTDGAGNLVSNQFYINAAQRVATQKTQLGALRASDSTWSPEGPDTLVGSYSSASSHGVARVNCITFHPTDTNTYWVGVAQGGIWKTTNAGKSYTPLNNNLPIIRISDIAVDRNNTDVLYVSVGDYAYFSVALTTDGRKRNTHYGMGVWKTTDGGKSWKATGLSYQQTQRDQSLIRRVFVNPANSSELLAVGISGAYKSIDGGDTWTQTSQEMIWDAEMNESNSNSILMSSGYSSNLKQGKAAIWKSTDFGNTWKKANAPIVATGVVQRVELTISKDSNLCYAVACGMDRGFHSFYVSNNGGTDWTLQADASTAPNILSWGDGRPPNNSGGQGTYDLLVYADRNNPGQVYVGGVNMWGSPDSGKSWDGISYWLRYYGFTPHADQHFMKYNPLDKKYYLCNDGGIFRTDTIKIGSWTATDTTPGYQFPTKWEDVSSGMQITSFYSVATSKNNAGFLAAGAQDNGTFYRDSTGKWRNINGGDGMDCIIDHNDPNTAVVSSQYGNFYITRNGGNSRARYLTNSSSQNYAWTTPVIHHPTNGSFYVGGSSTILEYKNGWLQEMGFFPTATDEPVSAMDIADSNDKYMVVTKRLNYIDNELGEVFLSDNGGLTWRNITANLPDSLYFTSVKMDDRNPGKCWVTCGGFANGMKVFATNDTGKTWQNISNNLPNIPVNCVVQDEYSGNNALYVGTDVGVYYTNDSLSNWILYSKALPNVIVSDLEILNKNRRIYCATFGRGVWSAEVIDTVFAFEKLDTGSVKEPESVEYLNWKNSTFELYPNPNNGTINLNYRTDLQGVWELKLIDVMGRTISEEKVEINSPTGDLQRNFNLLPGLYYLRLSKSGKTKSISFVVE